VFVYANFLIEFTVATTSRLNPKRSIYIYNCGSSRAALVQPASHFCNAMKIGTDLLNTVL